MDGGPHSGQSKSEKRLKRGKVLKVLNVSGIAETGTFAPIAPQRT
jgi:hypothetical protein